ncbi:MAG: Flp pilus assembly protein CpaB [Symbiobacteriia bacterium]
MNKGRIFKVIFLPVFAGLLATAGVYYYLQHGQPATGRVETVSVVVAARPVPAKTVLAKDMLTTKDYPKALVGRNEVTSLADAVGKATTVPLAQDEVLLRTKLATEDAKIGLAYHIPAGMRALTIAANEQLAVGGFPEPGDLLDIAATFTGPAGMTASRLILEGIPILAVGQSMETTPNGQARVVPSLTVAVTPQQALVIATAEKKAALRYLLRPANKDERGVGSIQVDEAAVLGTTAAAVPGK